MVNPYLISYFIQIWKCLTPLNIENTGSPEQFKLTGLQQVWRFKWPDPVDPLILKKLAELKRNQIESFELRGISSWLVKLLLNISNIWHNLICLPFYVIFWFIDIYGFSLSSNYMSMVNNKPT